MTEGASADAAVAADATAAAAVAAGVLAERLGVDRHDVFVVLGSGWSGAAEVLGAGPEVAMADLPGFTSPSVPGHRGLFRSVEIAGMRVLVALGRLHLYEGHPPTVIVHGVQTAAAAGCRVAVLTNAAGVISAPLAERPLGSVAVITDQLNLTGVSPLRGAAFVDLTDLYSAALRALVREVEPELRTGVYAGVHGPEFETPAEIRAYAALGADLVGMSTVLEAIAARRAGMEVLGLALATNLAAGIGPSGVDAEDVMAVAAASGTAIGELLRRIVVRMGEGRNDG